MEYRTLIINPGSTSTKYAVYEGTGEILSRTIRHTQEELKAFNSIGEQFDFRAGIIEKDLASEGIPLESLNTVMGRGGLLRPINGGVWKVNDRMLKDLKAAERGEHASNLGGIIARSLAEKAGIESYIADPVVVDELEDIARLSGHPELPRISIFHALNQKAVARQAAEELNKPYKECRLIVAHMGGGISVGAHAGGRVIDVNNALNGDGPFSPERSGTLPAGQLVEMCFSGKQSKKEIMGKLKGHGGMLAYLGTADGSEVADRIEKGDKEAELIFSAMAYQVAKEIGSMAAVLSGKIDGIVLTGGLAYSSLLTGLITKRVEFIAKVYLFPGEGEMEALRDAALRILSGEEEAGEY